MGMKAIERNEAHGSSVPTSTMTRRKLTIALGLVAATLLAACARSPDAPPTAPDAPARLELRASSDRLVLDGDVRAVRVVRDPERDGRALAIDLQDAARPRLYAFTSRHVGERIVTVVGGHEAMTLTLRDPIDATSLLLTSRNDADVDEMRRRLTEGAIAP
jgi:hypothetical protein